jgi:cell division protein FtsB
MSQRSPSPRARRNPRAARVANRGAGRRWVRYGLIFLTVALVVNAIVGDQGLTELLRVKRQLADLTAALEAARARNARLREETQRLKTDPHTIEEAARRELGLMRKDELLFIVKDSPQKAGER